MMSKKDYLHNYERFIIDVRTDYTNYTERDWLKADKRFNRFNDTLTKRFGDKLTPEEKIRKQGVKIDDILADLWETVKR